MAHLHIARRVFDSITPGFRQLGSVWLPLPHILLLPFVWNMGWWHSGLAGACLSIPSYVLGCAGIYRLARMWLDMPAAVVVVAFYGLNPGLLYMATTAMTEPLFLAEMIWAVLLIVQYQRALDPQSPDGPSAGRLLIRAGLVLVARYSPATTGGCTRPSPGFLLPGRCWPPAADGAGRGRRWARGCCLPPC